MAKNKLDQYRGSLTPAQIAEGMNAAQQNATRLIEDAKLLLDSGRYPTALSLSILAIEEVGKNAVLRSLALARSREDISQAWKEYRSHTKKNATWILPELVAAGARKLGDFRPMFDDSSDHPYLLDQLKQIGLYTDCLGKAHWSQPQKVIEESLTRTMVQTAELLARDRETTPREIELWVKHMKPVWKDNLGWMQQALVSWHREMREEGLIYGDDEDMERFIHGEL